MNDFAWLWQAIVGGLATTVLLYGLLVVYRAFVDYMFFGRQSSAAFRRWLSSALASSDPDERASARPQILSRMALNFVLANVVWLVSQMNFYGFFYHLISQSDAAVPTFVLPDPRQALSAVDFATVIYVNVATLIALLLMVRSLYWASLYRRTL